VVNKHKQKQHELIGKLIPHTFHGCNKAGEPLYIERTGRIVPQALLASTSDEDIMWAHVVEQETQVLNCAAQSKKLGRVVDRFVTLMDLKGLSSSHRSILKFTKTISFIDTQYYPGRLSQLFLINPPFIFPVLWGIAKHWLDPVVRSKIHVLSGDPRKKLLKFFDADQLPVEYGGTCTSCEGGCVPQPVDTKELMADLKLQASDQADDLTTIKVGARKKFVLEEKGKAGTTFGWFFTLKKNNIAFQVDFLPDSKRKLTKDEEKRHSKGAPAGSFSISSPVRVQADKFPGRGQYQCHEDGTIIYCWNNSFSWFTGKDLSYITTRLEAGEGLSVEADNDELAQTAGEAIDDEGNTATDKHAQLPL
jgi:hypothetical protein